MAVPIGHEHVEALRQMISAGDDVVRRLRERSSDLGPARDAARLKLRADDIERDVTDLRRRLQARRALGRFFGIGGSDFG